MPLFAIAPIALAAAIAPLRPSVEPIDSNWAVIDRTSTDQCELTVTGNGRFYLFSVTGLNPGMPARYRIENGDMKPIDWRIQPDSSGNFARYYLPFRWHRQGGVVTVSISSETCEVSSSFEWRRGSGLSY